MPIYEYTCGNCEESFDKIVRFSEADQLPDCPACGENKTRKKISAGAVIGGSRGSCSSVSRPGSSPYT